MENNISVSVYGSVLTSWIKVYAFGEEQRIVYSFSNVGNACSSYYKIVISEEKTIYQITVKDIISKQDHRHNPIVFAIIIPQGYKLVGKATPYDVLHKIKEKFFTDALISQSGAYEYKYSNLEEYDHILDDVVKEFSLEETKVRLKPMNGGTIGCIICSEQEIREFFKDIRYDFSGYKEILVADVTASITPSQDYSLINNIEIPRRPKYRVIVDNKQDQRIFSKEEEIEVYSYPSKRKYYNDRVVKFSIAQLIDGRKIEGVEFDEETEVVTVSTINWATPKKKTITITIEPPELKNEVLDNLKFSFFSSHEISHNVNFTLKGDDIKYFDDKSINVRVKQSVADVYEIVGSPEYRSIDESKGEIIINVRKKEEIKKQPSNGNGQGFNKALKCGSNTNSRTNSSEPVLEKPLNCVEITLTANEKVYSEMKSGITTVLLRKGSDKRTLTWAKVEFSNDEKCNNNTYTGHFYFDKEFKDDSEIVVKTKKTEYHSKICNVRFDGKRAHIDIESNLRNKEKISFSRKHRKGIARIIIAFVSFVIGIYVGCHFTSSKVGESEISEENEAFDVEKFLSDADESLRNPSVTFAKVDSIYKDYNEHITEINEKVQSGAIKDTVPERIVGHYHFAQHIINNKIDSIKEYVQQPEQYHIWKLHSDRYRDIPNDDNKKERFKDKYREIKSFADVDLLYEYCCNDCNKYFDNQEEQKKHLEKCDKCSKMICPKKMDEHKKTTHKPLATNPSSTQKIGGNSGGTSGQGGKNDTEKER